jgi:hypothetical protein
MDSSHRHSIGPRWRLALLALAVLAIHLWLLGGIPRVIAPVQRALPWLARTVAPAVDATQPATAPAPRVATNPSPKVAPPPPASRKQKALPSTAAQASSPRPHEAPQVAMASASAPLPETHTAGAAPATAAATKFAVAPSARLHYEVVAQTKGLTLKGQAELDWHNEGGKYEAQMQMSSPVPFVRPRVQRSTGLVTAQGLAPVRFSDKSRSEEATHFDREQGKVIFSSNQPEAVLEPGAQDRLSIVMQLGAMIAGNPSKFPVGSEITVQTASTKEAQPWTFTVEGPEMLDLPGGRTDTLRLTRNPRKQYDVKVELWLAPGHAYAPVRLRLTQPNGDWVDQQWSSTDRA